MLLRTAGRRILVAAARVSACAAALAPACACGPHGDGPSADGGTSYPVGFLGVEGGAPDFELLTLDPNEIVQKIDDGGVLSIILPPQGGRVVFAGVRATNVEGSQMTIVGALHDLTTKQVRFDQRTINLVPTGDGWGVSAPLGMPASDAISSFSNIGVCPNEWTPTNVYGNAYGLEMRIVDRVGREVSKKIVVTPACNEPGNVAECLCICKGGYVLGEACSADDGGVGDGGNTGDGGVDGGDDGGDGGVDGGDGGVDGAAGHP